MKRILYVVDGEESAQFRYRVKNVGEILSGTKRWNIEWVMKDDLQSVDLNEYEFVIILRQTAKDEKILKFIDRAHNVKKKILFDLDDLVFDYIDLWLLMRSTNSKNVFYWAGYFWGIRRIAKKVDGFITTNEFLAKKLKRSFERPVKVIRNSLNSDQIDVSDRWVKKKNGRMNLEKKMDKVKQFKIGYFSGSPTHAKDFRLVEVELMKFLKTHEDVVLKIVGYMEFSDEMREIIEDGRVEIVGIVDYVRLQELISKVDVNIAPLVLNDFTNCKSELKFFEAAAVETTTIASPTYTFKKAIKDGENGFLAYPGEWYNKLEYLYEHPDENRKIAREARKYALKHYYGTEFLKEVEEAYDYFVK